MLSTRSWNRCVCTTHPWFTVTPSLQRRQVGLGQPVGLAPDAAADPCAPSERSQTLSTGVPGRGAGEPRRRDHLDEGVGELVAPDERAPQRVLRRPQPADEQPLAPRSATPAASSAGDHQHQPASSAAAPPARPVGEQARAPATTPSAEQRRRPSRGRAGSTSTRARATPQPRGRVVRAAVVAVAGDRGAAWSAGCRATTCPPSPCVRRGAADSTATRPRLGTLRPGAAIPELPTNARLPIFTRSMRSQPPPSS